MICLAQMLHFPHIISNFSLKKVKPWCWALFRSCSITPGADTACKQVARSSEEMGAHPGTSQQQPVLRM